MAVSRTASSFEAGVRSVRYRSRALEMCPLETEGDAVHIIDVISCGCSWGSDRSSSCKLNELKDSSCSCSDCLRTIEPSSGDLESF
jgi:hypothetical protein